MNHHPPWRRARRVAKVVAAVVASLLVLAALAPTIVSGARFGRVVGWLMPATRGAISVAAGSWSWGAVWAVWRGRPAPLSLDGIRIVDPEGVEVLRAEHVDGNVELSRDRARLVLRDLHIRRAFWRFAQMKNEREVGFLAALQPARRTAAPRPRPRGGGLASFSLSGAQLDGVDLTFDLPGWGLVLTDVHALGQLALTSVPREAGAGATATGRARGTRTAFTFEATGADLRGGGLLRVLSGRARTELPFSAGRIDRVATTADKPDLLQLTASGVATGTTRLDLQASFGGISGGGDRGPRGKHRGGQGQGQGAGIDLHAHFTDAVDAVRAVMARRFGTQAAPVTVGGAGAALDLAVVGPFDQVRVETSVRGFDLGARGLVFAGVGGTLAVEPAAARARLTGLTFGSPAGGRLTLDAEVDRLLVRGALALDHFATAPYLPAPLRPLAGGVLDGKLRAQLDLVGRSASLDQVALTLTRPGRHPGPTRTLRLVGGAGARAPAAGRGTQTLQLGGARFVQGTLILPEVTFDLAGGQVSARARLTLTDAEGRLRPPLIDLDARARHISFARLAGATFARGDLDFRARVRGALDDLAITLEVPAGQSLRVFGELCQLPVSTTMRFDGQTLTLPEFRLRGDSGSQLALEGRIERSGELGLTLAIGEFPLEKLPGLSESDVPVTGTISGRLRASGPLRVPRLDGQLTIDHTRFQGRPIGGGALTVRPGPGGAVHASGQLIEGVALDGTLAPDEGSARGSVSLRLRSVRLDPFLAPFLPGGARAAGLVSGTLEARIAPREPAELEGRLSELTLTVTGVNRAAPRPGAPAPPPPPALELHAVADVRLSARAGGGPIRIEAAHFAGTAGSVELAGESTDGSARGWVRGRLTLGSIAPLVLPWSRGVLTRLSGDLDFDVAARADRGAAPTVTGTVRVATPVSLRVAGLPFDARLAGGVLRLDDDGTTHLDLPVTLGSGTVRLTGTVTSPIEGDPQIAVELDGDLDAGLLALVAPGWIAWARGGARLHASVQGRPLREGEVAVDDLRVRARLLPAPLTLAFHAWPDVAIQLASGAIDLDQQALSARALRVTVGGGRADLTIGAAPDGAAVVQLGSLQRPRLARMDVPVRGRVVAAPVPPLVVDDASLVLRLAGDFARRASLSGEVTVTGAHVPPGKARSKAPPASGAKPARGGSATTSVWLRRPELGRVDLDVRVRAPRGAITVELNNLPDVHVGVDYRVRGTPAAPQLSGKLQGADLFSSFALFLRGIFQ